jgi:hypothetical protein
MLVHRLWDQEDIYDAPAVYTAIKPKGSANDKAFLAIDPWHHGQMIGNDGPLRAIKVGSDTAPDFRQKVLALHGHRREHMRPSLSRGKPGLVA